MASDENVLTAEKAFVCLTLFDIIRMPLALFPLLIVYMVEVPSHSSIKLNAFSYNPGYCC